MPPNKPRPEILAAAQWWASLLRTPPEHDTGDPEQSAIARDASRHAPAFSEEQIQRFEKALVGHIEKDIDQVSWDLAKPHMGSALRCLVCDYGPPAPLLEAAKEVGIYIKLSVPFKTYMWIDPGSVRVRSGYTAEIVSIYPQEPAHDPD